MGESRKRAGASEDLQVSALLEEAEAVISAHGKRMTPVRAYIYERLLREGPLGAYELLNGLEKVGNRQPPTAYRTLEFLESVGLVRKLRGASKYIALSRDDASDVAGYVVCRACGTAEPISLDHQAKELFLQAQGLGFADIDQIVELSGVCSASGCGAASSSRET